jgi:hypothetical protein
VIDPLDREQAINPIDCARRAGEAQVARAAEERRDGN